MNLNAKIRTLLRSATTGALVAGCFAGLGTSASLMAASPAGAVPSGGSNYSPTFTVPTGTSVVTFTADGGGGGWNGGSQVGNTYSSGCSIGETITVTPGDTYSAVVGRSGGNAPFGSSGVSGGAGWTRGGDGGAGGGDYDGGGGGGGSTAILHSGSPILVAGGGGGMSGADVTGGDACGWGSLNGGDGSFNYGAGPLGGSGATGGSGGNSGYGSIGGDGGSYPSGVGGNGADGGSYNPGGGGGGGGYAGGGGGASDGFGGSGGAAGSSYASGSSTGYPEVGFAPAQNAGSNGNAHVVYVSLTGISATTGTQGTAYSGQIQGFAGVSYLDGVGVCVGAANQTNCARAYGGTLGTASLYALNNSRRALFSVSPALPQGLTLNSQTGAITGTPTYGSSKDYTVTGKVVATSDTTKVYAMSTGSFHLEVSGDPAPWTCSSTFNAGVVLGQSYVNSSGDLTTWSQGSWYLKKLKNLGLNTATSTMYGIVQRYSGVTLWSMAVSSGDLAAPVSLGAVTGLPAGVRFIGGDVDSSTGTYYLSSKNQLFAVDPSTRVATEVTTVPSGWKFGRDIVVFGGSVWSVLPNKVESFNLTTSTTRYATLARNIRGNAPTVVTNGDGNTIAWINAKSGNVYQATHLTDGGTITVSAVGSGPVTPPLKVGDGAGGCLA